MDDPVLRGRLLVATPALQDPNFARSVILLLEHGDDGAIGLILNRRTETPVREVLPQWWAHVSEPSMVFLGGPVSPDGAICLGRAATVSAVSDEQWTFFDGTVGTVDLSNSPDDLADGTQVRVYAGYAGWGAEQLADEIESGAWYLVDGSADDVFCTDPDELWRVVLRRQPGHLAMVANFPADPSLN